MIKYKHIYPMIKPAIRFIKFRILHVDDSPYSLAMGVAVGLFVAWTPTMGFQMLISLLMSIVFKANKFLSISLVWISNIFTLIPVYLPAYLLGRQILQIFNISDGLTKEQVIEMLKRISSFNIIFDVWTVDFWKHLLDFIFKIGLPLWIGSVIIGLLLAVVSYILTYRLIVWHREKYPRRRFKKHLWTKRAQTPTNQ